MEQTPWEKLCSLPEGAVVWNRTNNQIYRVVAPYTGPDGEQMGESVGIERMDLTRRGFMTGELTDLTETDHMGYECDINDLSVETKVSLFLSADNVIHLRQSLKRVL